MSASREPERPGEVVVLSLDGDLDLSRAHEIQRTLRRAEALMPDVLVLDMRRVRFIDSTMLREIVAAHARARNDGRRLVVAADSEAVKRVFRITLLERRLEIVDDPGDVSADRARDRRRGGGR